MVPHPPLIVPEIGKGEERRIQKTIDAYGEAAQRIAKIRPETIVLISPHQVMYADYFHISPGTAASGDFGRFRAEQVKFQTAYDTEFISLCASMRLEKGCRQERLERGTKGWTMGRWYRCIL